MKVKSQGDNHEKICERNISGREKKLCEVTRQEQVCLVRRHWAGT